MPDATAVIADIGGNERATILCIAAGRLRATRIRRAVWFRDSKPVPPGINTLLLGQNGTVATLAAGRSLIWGGPNGDTVHIDPQRTEVIGKHIEGQRRARRVRETDEIRRGINSKRNRPRRAIPVCVAAKPIDWDVIPCPVSARNREGNSQIRSRPTSHGNLETTCRWIAGCVLEEYEQASIECAKTELNASPRLLLRPSRDYKP